MKGNEGSGGGSGAIQVGGARSVARTVRLTAAQRRALSQDSAHKEEETPAAAGDWRRPDISQRHALFSGISTR